MTSPTAHVVFVTPPVAKPAEPGLSAAAAARALAALGVRTEALDASIGWHRFALGRGRLERRLEDVERAGAPPGALLAWRRAVRHVTASPTPLRRPATYASRRVYSSAISHLENALDLASGAAAGFRVRIAAVDLVGRRPERSADLAAIARAPTPFDAYFLEELIPELERRGATHVGVSLTYLDQAAGAFRLARLLAERLPSATRILGGPLVACWAAVGAPLGAEPFLLFDVVLAGATDADMATLARSLGAAPLDGPPAGAGVHTVDLDATPWEAYLTPSPRVPAALARGCSWRRCTFCPDHLHPRHRPPAGAAAEDLVRAVAARFPAGAVLHLTDSALSPAHLERIAAVIAAERLPVRWHGFVRVEPDFADPELVARLAAGGCAMLQLGVETASPRLLDSLGKGAGSDGVPLARRVLRACRAAGVPVLVYLLFGLPGELDADRELTLAFVEEEAPAIHGLNHAILNLPRQSAMHRRPDLFGITEITPFAPGTDLSLYDDFRCGSSHPRIEARRWLGRRFSKNAAVRRILGDLRGPFKANHLCFLPG